MISLVDFSASRDRERKYRSLREKVDPRSFVDETQIIEQSVSKVQIIRWKLPWYGGFSNS